MNPLVLSVALGLVCLDATGLEAEKLGTRLAAGPTIGEKISRFDSSNVAHGRLCWSCYG